MSTLLSHDLKMICWANVILDPETHLITFVFDDFQDIDTMDSDTEPKRMD
jgi:hypothetical protein